MNYRFLSAIFLAAGVLAASLPSCTKVTVLPPCNPSTTTVRMFCNCDIAMTSRARAAAGQPPLCTYPFSPTMCVDRSAPGVTNVGAGFLTFLMGIEKLRDNGYNSAAGPYIELPSGNIAYLRCPLQRQGPSGLVADCLAVEDGTNPWPGQPVLDLDEPSNLWTPPGPRRRAVPPGPRPASGGGGQSTDTPTMGDDCSVCIANAACDGLTQDQCITMHCAAVCPYGAPDPVDDGITCEDDGTGGSLTNPNCVPSGGACDGTMGCCSGTNCIPSDVGSTCVAASG